MVVLMTAPAARPISAGGTLVVTLNSAMASGFGNVPIVPNCGSLLSTPSSEKLLLVARWPLAEMAAPPERLKREDSDEPFGLLEPGPPLPARGSPLLNERASGPPPKPTLLARTTPGVSVASCVKLLPESGNSVTSRPVMTLPRSLVSDCTCDGSDVTVTVPPTCPAVTLMSATAVLDVCTTTFS